MEIDVGAALVSDNLFQAWFHFDVYQKKIPELVYGRSTIFYLVVGLYLG